MGILSLPLSPFERMMVADDDPAHPMMAIVELVFQGKIQRTVIENAVSFALDRHPLLRSRVDKTIWKRPCWVATSCPQVEFADSIDSSPLGSYLNIYKEPGLRVRVVDEGSCTRVAVEIHHACCDGVGAFQFLEDVLVSYANQWLTPESQLTARSIEPKRLQRRNHFGWNSKNPGQWLYHLYFGLRLVVQFSANPPKPLNLRPRKTPTKSASSDIDAANSERMHLVTREADFEMLKRLRTAAAKNNVTLNDLLVRDMFLAMRDWNASCGDNDPNTMRRLLIPCDLRCEKDRMTSAANIMSYAFLNRRNADCLDPTNLLRGIQTEMDYIRQEKASLYFIRTLETIRAIPGAIRLGTQTDSCFATCLLSNLGDPSRQFSAASADGKGFHRERGFPSERGKLRVGDLVLDKIVAYPPLRPKTYAGLIVGTYANQLTACFRFDASHFTRADCEQFVDSYFGYLERTARPQ